MRFACYQIEQTKGLAIETGRAARGLMETDRGYPGDLDVLVRKGPPALDEAAKALGAGHPIDLARISRLPPLRAPEKVICVGLNYREHSAESGFKQPDYPTLFSRFNSSLIGDGAQIVRPRVSDQLDFEGELAAVIGKGGRNIPLADALDHVIGYSIFNDGSIRDYQFKTPQWTMGKNFDDSGGSCPRHRRRVTSRLQGSALADPSQWRGGSERFNQRHGVRRATLIAIISEAITLRSGDVIVTGTTSGVGLSPKPLFMKAADTVEVEIERIGILANPIVNAT